MASFVAEEMAGALEEWAKAEVEVCLDLAFGGGEEEPLEEGVGEEARSWEGA